MRAAGITSCHSQPLGLRTSVLGALNLYAREANAFGPDERARAAALAEEAAFTMAVTQRYAEKAQLSEQLGAALVSRSVIDQALGIIIGQNRVDAEGAFAVLRRMSQNRNVKLRDVAAQLVADFSTQPRPSPSASPRPRTRPVGG